MNNIQDELLQLKIQGYCLDYPNNLDLELFIDRIKYAHDSISDYCDEKNIWKRKGNTWSLLSAITSIFKLIIRYLEQPIQNDDFLKNV